MYTILNDVQKLCNWNLVHLNYYIHNSNDAKKVLYFWQFYFWIFIPIQYGLEILQTFQFKIPFSSIMVEWS